MPYQFFDDISIRHARKDVQRALKVLLDEGIIAQVGHIQYEADRFSCRIKCRLVNAPTDDEHEYNKVRRYKGLPPFNTLIEWKGELFYIVGWRPRASKRPVLVADLDGQQWNFPLSFVQGAKIIKEGE